MREAIPLTQIELAKMLGVHRRSVQNWEYEEGNPLHSPVPAFAVAKLIEIHDSIF